MQFLINIENVAHVIQLAVAPVFLLTSIGAVLSVMTIRLVCSSLSHGGMNKRFGGR
ncbi:MULTISPECIES: hypothetical protein [Methylococcus]|uniref:Uncharacterized protein n=1 Tax=Methylococcus capsulatus TaxID=414 RepID=A0ABZ2F3J6_METCP|nr:MULTISPECIES: hypothetical protein [Methylococcus]